MESIVGQINFINYGFSVFTQPFLHLLINTSFLPYFMCFMLLPYWRLDRNESQRMQIPLLKDFVASQVSSGTDRKQTAVLRQKRMTIL